MHVKIPHQRSPFALKFEASEVWCPPASSEAKPEEREFVVDSGASMHMLSRKDLSSVELETVRVSRMPTTVVTANGEGQTNAGATVYVKELDSFVTVALLSLEKLCEDQGYAYEWTSGQKPQFITHDRRIQCSTENYVPIVVHDLSIDSSSSAIRSAPASLPQDFVIPTLRPTTTRSESMSSQVWRDPSSESTETENTNINEDNEKERGDPLRDLPEWLHEFTENLVDERVPAYKDAPASSSRESASRPLRKVVSDKHSICIHLSKDRNCDICIRSTITRTSCRKRIGTVVSGATNFGDFTADHKVLSEGCESRNNLRYAADVIQDLTTQWIQSYPCKAKTFEETQKSLRKVLESTKKAQVIYWQFLGIWQILRRIILESFCVNIAQIGDKWNYWKSSTQN